MLRPTAPTKCIALASAALLLFCICFPASAQEASERATMVRQIESHAERTGHLLGEEGLSERVLEGMRGVPRHRFVPLDRRDLA